MRTITSEEFQREEVVVPFFWTMTLAFFTVVGVVVVLLVALAWIFDPGLVYS